MFKLDAAMKDAKKRAEKDPDLFQVGSTAWVPARFTAEQPMAKHRSRSAGAPPAGA